MTIATQKITPCLWFDTEAEDAAKFYVAIFKNSKIRSVNRYGKEGTEVHGKPAGSVMAVEFEIEGQKFVGLNGGPQFKFSEAISFQIHCKSQEEIDFYWSRLTEGGKDCRGRWCRRSSSRCCRTRTAPSRSA
jgi:predicted 3-demethylubiquinone-9 3-methyltransferase (glyoxalase superfamily)